MKRLRRVLALLTLVAGSAIATSWVAPAASAGPTFTCVSTDVDTCTITIPLSSNLNEQISSTMPDTREWYDSVYGGTPGCAPTFTEPSWNTARDVWTAQLTTGGVEPSGCEATVTFRHITSPHPQGPYSFVSIRGPLHATHAGIVTITANVKPKPPAGHVIVQRKHGSSWSKVAALHYSSAHHHWQVTFKWTPSVPTTWTVRILATAYKTLTATPSSSIKITTIR